MKNTNYYDYEIAKQEIDELIQEGFFGEEALQLINIRSNLSMNNFLLENLNSWIKDDTQFGKNEVKKYISLFLKLYSNAFNKKSQETIDILTQFWRGSIDNNMIENISSYTEYARLHQEYKNTIHEMKNKQNVTIADKKKIAGNMINAYSKGVEFVSKIFTICIILIKISNDEKYNIEKIDRKTIHKKTILFRELSKGKYDLIIDSINRNLRNAEAHLNLKFIPFKGVFVYKKKIRNKKQNIEIQAEDMILNIYPKIGWVVQGFIYSGTLLVIVNISKNDFRKKILEIFKNN